MHCPVCKTTQLEETIKEFGLKSYSCSSCGGSWIRYQDYQAWKSENHQQDNGAEAASTEYLPEYDSKKACICPDCGHILIKYNVNAQLPLTVDHCGTCSGIWLDKNEWEVLIKNNLHQQLYRIFTDTWQHRLRREMTRQRFDEHYKKKFGEADYERLREAREWIQKSDFKNEFISFIMDDDPYVL